MLRGPTIRLQAVYGQVSAAPTSTSSSRAIVVVSSAPSAAAAPAAAAPTAAHAAQAMAPPAPRKSMLDFILNDSDDEAGDPMESVQRLLHPVSLNSRYALPDDVEIGDDFIPDREGTSTLISGLEEAPPEEQAPPAASSVP
eukprot:tig00000571_g2186.t1